MYAANAAKIAKAKRLIKSGVVDKDLFTSSEFRELLSHKISWLCKEYHAKVPNIELLYDERDARLTAYTDGKSITMNAGHYTVTKHQDTSEKVLVLFGRILHELMHNLFTDFTIRKKCCESIRMLGILFPEVTNPDLMGIYAEFKSWVRSNRWAGEYLMKKYADFDNILEDGFIEDYSFSVADGELIDGMSFKRAQEFADFPDAKDYIKQDNGSCISHLVNMESFLLCAAKLGRLKYDTADETYKPLADIIAIKKDIDDCVYETSAFKRAMRKNEIFLKLFSYYKNAYEENQKEAENAKSNTGMESMTPNGSSSGKIAKASNQNNQGGNQPTRRIRLVVAVSSESDDASDEEKPDESSSNKGQKKNDQVGHFSDESESDDGSSDDANDSESSDDGESQEADDEESSDGDGKDESKPDGDNSSDDTDGSESDDGKNQEADDEESSDGDGKDESKPDGDNSSDDTDGSESDDDESQESDDEESSDGDGKDESKPDGDNSSDDTDGSESDDDGENQESDDEESSDGDGKDENKPDGEDPSDDSDDTDGSESDDGESQEADDGEELSDDNMTFIISPELKADLERQIQRVKKQVGEQKSKDQNDAANCKQFAAEIKASKAEAIHLNVDCNVKRPSVECQPSPTVNAITKEASSLASEMAKRLGLLKRADPDPISLSGFRSGKTFNAKNVYTGDGRYFTRKTVKIPQKAVAICILVDESGSMQGSHIVAAKTAALAIYKFASTAHIPCAVFGHHGSMYEPRVTIDMCADFDDQNKDQGEKQILNLTPQEANRDGYALKAVGEHLLRRPEETKLLIIISDGMPNAYCYTAEPAKADTAATAVELRRKGIKLFAAAIGDSRQRIKEIYTEGFMDIQNLSALPTEMLNLVRRYIRK